MTQTILDVALGYARLGWHVFPLVPGAKTPAGRWRDTSTTDADQIASWWADNPNYGLGIDCGKSGLAVVDIDSYKDVELQVIDRFPPTLAARTARGGMHYIYTQPDEPIRNSASKLADGIDTRGEGGYIVAPPTVTDDGAYTWSSFVDPVPLPAWVAEALAPEPAPEPSAPVSTSGINDKWGESVLQGELGRIALSTPHQDRNHNLFLAACKVYEAVKGGHIDHDYADQQLRSAAHAKGLDVDEVDATLESAWGRTQERHPAERPAREAVVDRRQPRVGLLGDRPSNRLLSYSDLKDLPPARWLLQDKLPEGFTILFGHPGSGKTFVALDWALTLASADHPVVFCAGEGTSGLLSRMSAWMHTYPGSDPTDNFYVLTLGGFPRLTDPASVEELHQSLSSMSASPALLVVDTWARAMVGADENKYQDVQAGIAALDEVRDAHGSNVLLVHHAPVPSHESSKPRRPRGHGALDGAADAIWRVEAPESGAKQGDVVTLTCTKMKDFQAPRPSKLQLIAVQNSLVPRPWSPPPTYNPPSYNQGSL